VLDTIFSANPSLVELVIDHYDIDRWYEQEEPEKYRRLFGASQKKPADFWTDGYLRAFVPI
jgi:hypothetical protein